MPTIRGVYVSWIYMIFYISWQHLGNECNLEGFCVPLGHSVGEWIFLNIYLYWIYEKWWKVMKPIKTMVNQEKLRKTMKSDEKPKKWWQTKKNDGKPRITMKTQKKRRKNNSVSFYYGFWFYPEPPECIRYIAIFSERLRYMTCRLPPIYLQKSFTTSQNPTIDPKGLHCRW